MTYILDMNCSTDFAFSVVLYSIFQCTINLFEDLFVV